jgi:hypothetical protein
LFLHVVLRGLVAGDEREHSLHRDVQSLGVEGLEVDLGDGLSILRWVLKELRG